MLVAGILIKVRCIAFIDRLTFVIKSLQNMRTSPWGGEASGLVVLVRGNSGMRYKGHRQLYVPGHGAGPAVNNCRTVTKCCPLALVEAIVRV